MSESRNKAITDLSDIITRIEAKLHELVLDLEIAKKNLAILQHDDNESVKSVTNKATVRSSVFKTRRSKRERENQSSDKASYIPTTIEHKYVIGNRINILNPSNKKQTVPGTVTGYTRDGLVKVELDNRVKTRRKAKNLVLIQEEA